MDGEIAHTRCLSFNGITSFNPDHVASIAHTLISTNPFFKAVALMISSVISVATFDAFLGHDTHIIPLGFISFFK